MTLPGLWTSIGYGVAVLVGLVGTYFLGRFLAAYKNVQNAPKLADKVTDNREQANKENQDLNDQFSKLPE